MAQHEKIDSICMSTQFSEKHAKTLHINLFVITDDEEKKTALVYDNLLLVKRKEVSVDYCLQ